MVVLQFQQRIYRRISRERRRSSTRHRHYLGVLSLGRRNWESFATDRTENGSIGCGSTDWIGSSDLGGGANS